jgi:hypothetical protein
MLEGTKEALMQIEVKDRLTYRFWFCICTVVFLIGAVRIYSRSITGSIAGPEFKERLTIGVEEANTAGQDPYQFASIANIDMDKEGNIYVLDFRDVCVKKFNKKGEFLAKILKKGKGPKEITNAFSFVINPYSDTLFVLHEFGYLIKEVDLNGSFLANHRLPEQFFGYFEFIDSNRLVFFSRVDKNGEEHLCFKILNIKTRTIEKSFSPSIKDLEIYNKRFALTNGSLLTSHDDKMEILYFDVKSGKLAKTIKFPGDFKQNFNKVVQEDRHSKRLQAIMYHYLQPVLINQELYVLMTQMDYNHEHERSMSFPTNIDQTLFVIKGQDIYRVSNFKGFGGMKFARVRDNKVLVYADDPYPRLKVFKILPQSEQ